MLKGRLVSCTQVQVQAHMYTSVTTRKYKQCTVGCLVTDQFNNNTTTTYKAS